MDCDRTEQCLLYLWAEMDPEESRAFAGHLRECPACRDELARLEPLVSALRKMESVELPPVLVERIKPHLVEAVRGGSPRLRLWSPKILAVAASVLVILGVSVLWKLLLTDSSKLPVLPQVTVPSLTDEDYLGALALVMIMDESEDASQDWADADDVLAAEIGELAEEIESLWAEVDQDLSPNDSNSEPADEQGSRRPYAEIIAAI